MIVNVLVKPNSFKEEIVENEDGTYEIRVKDKAEDNKANKRVINLISKEFGVHFSRIKIKNFSGRRKTVEIITE